jgi:hypothetical protein
MIPFPCGWLFLTSPIYDIYEFYKYLGSEKVGCIAKTVGEYGFEVSKCLILDYKSNTCFLIYLC